MLRRLFIGGALLWVCGGALHAQSEEKELYPVNAATLLGVGGYNLMDTYLTPSSRIPYKDGDCGYWTNG